MLFITSSFSYFFFTITVDGPHPEWESITFKMGERLCGLAVRPVRHVCSPAQPGGGRGRGAAGQ